MLLDMTELTWIKDISQSSSSSAATAAHNYTVNFMDGCSFVRVLSCMAVPTSSPHFITL